VAALVSVFLEDVANAVEARHYKDIGAPQTLGPLKLASTSLRLIGLTVMLNLLILPLYLIPGLNLALYYCLNGYLLSREYFDVVALKHLSPSAAADMRRQCRARLWLAGGATTFILTVPVVNMIAPVIGTGAMVHMFHEINGGR